MQNGSMMGAIETIVIINPMEKFLRFRMLGAMLCLATLLLGGCQTAGPNVIKIGVAAPLTGDQAQIGGDMANGVELAIMQANEKKILPGFTFEIAKADDQHNPAQAVSVAKKFVANADVMAVVGHFNSSCTQPASAVYNEAGLVNITPASTNPNLSRQGFKTFFRVAATDDVQGPRGAQYAAKTLKINSVFIIDDKTTYGKGLADEFEKEAVKQGIKVLGHQGITQGEKDFTALLTKVRPLKPELIYFGGIYSEGALLLRQTRALGIKAQFMGGDGIASTELVKLASTELAEGVIATMVGGDTKQIPGAEDFIEAYEAKYGTLGQWSAYGYDAANVVIVAIAQAAKHDRADVLRAMREIPSFMGVTGEIVFDEKGDNQNQFIGIFKILDGKLAYVGKAE